MKIHTIKSLFLLGVLLLLVSCDNEEFFELTNPAESPWQSLGEFEKAPIGAYYTLSGNGGNRTMFSHIIMAGEAFADGIALAPPENGFSIDADVEDMYNRATAGTSIALFDNPVWRNSYFAIGHANGALDFIADNDGNPFPEEGPGSTDRIEGELRFVRAYAYYQLAKIYAPVYPSDEPRLPFRVNQATSFDEAKSSEIASANQVYELIVDDLNKAKGLLPERYDANIHPESYADGRVNRFGAAALLAKVYFQMGRYDDALAEANFVIEQNGGDYDLSEEPLAAWNQTGIARGKETIWYYTLWAGDGLGGSSNWKHPRRFSWYSANRERASGPEDNGNRFMVSSDAFLKAAGWIGDNLEETAEAQQDLRYTQLFLRLEETGAATNPEPRAQFTTTRPYVWCDKYFRAGDRITNLPVLRLADIVLLRAIIRADLGSSQDMAGARADLNMVRNRAGIGDFAGSDAELADAIHLERFKELAFEGDRLYYLQGAKMPIPNGDRGDGTVPSDSPFFSEIPDFEKELNDGF